jgi:hypothetical protein
MWKARLPGYVYHGKYGILSAIEGLQPGGAKDSAIENAEVVI